MNHLPRVSVIVSNLNGERYLPRLLESLDRQEGVELETIVVDRHSTDGSRAILEGHPGVRVVQHVPETGLVSGYAEGARHARHELLFFCNEDVYLGDGCLADLAVAIRPGEGVGAADPWQWTYDGERWIHGGVRFRRALWDFESPYPFRSQNPVTELPPGAPSAFGCAGAMMIGADVYRATGGWDTSFFLDGEDIDLFIRAWQRGWRCATVPSARVFHAVGASNDKVVGKVRVGKRRYVSNRVNVSVVALKYFSLPSVLLGPAMWLLTLLKDAVLLRPRRVWMDLLVLRELVRRAPALIAFRRQNRKRNRELPGESFFRSAEHAEGSVGVPS
jgi:GT2 family glycosyltransferase